MIEIFIVLCLVVLNGVFALSELAIVSSRRSKLRSLAEAGRKGAKKARWRSQTTPDALGDGELSLKPVKAAA